MPTVNVRGADGKVRAVDAAVYRAQPDAYELLPGQQVLLESDSGVQSTLNAEDFLTDERAAEIAEGTHRTLAEHEQGGVVRQNVEHARFGGVGSAIRQGVESAASGATLGLSDVILHGGDDEFERADAQARRRQNATVDALAGIAGAVAPTLLTGGTGAAASLARLTPAGAAARGSTALGGARGALAEGAITGAGTAVRELALDDAPLTVERVAGALGSAAIFGGAAGVGGSMIARTARKGFTKAQKMADDLAAGKPVGRIDDDLADYRAFAKEQQAYLAAEAGGTQAVVAKQANRFRRLADEPIGLRERPQRLLDPLRREEKALRDAAEAAQNRKGALTAAERTWARKVLDKASVEGAETVKLKKEAAQAYATLTGKAFSRKVATKGVSVPAADARRFAQGVLDGELGALRAKALGNIESVLERNQQLQQRILAEVNPTPTLAGELSQSVQSGAQTYGLGAVAGLVPGGAVGAIAGIAARPIARLLKQRFSRAAQDSAQAADRAVGKLLGKAVPKPRVTGQAPRVGAAKAVASTVLAPQERRSSTKQSTRAIRARMNEVASMVDGGQASPAARRQLAHGLRAVAQVSPQVADQLETIGARRLAYLAQQMPRRPDYTAGVAGESGWRPNGAAIAQFARAIQAAEDPVSVLDKAAEGRATMAEIDALRQVYPEMYRAVQLQILEQLPELRASLPYKNKLALSVFFGVPVAAAMDPRIFNVLQSQFPPPEGAEAPRPALAQGASPPQPTPAQERAG